MWSELVPEATLLVLAVALLVLKPLARSFLEALNVTNGQLTRIGTALWCVSDEIKRVGAEQKRQHQDALERTKRAQREYLERREREKREENRPTSNENLAAPARELLDKMAETARSRT